MSAHTHTHMHAHTHTHTHTHTHREREREIGKDPDSQTLKTPLLTTYRLHGKRFSGKIVTYIRKSALSLSATFTLREGGGNLWQPKSRQ